MIFRRSVPFAFGGFVVVLAGVLALGWSVWWLAPLRWLGQFQLFHIVAHAGIFAGVVMLFQPHRRSTAHLWALVLAGSVLIELAQIVAGNPALTRALLLDSSFDIGVDLAGAAVCWRMLTHRSSVQLSHSPF